MSGAPSKCVSHEPALQHVLEMWEKKPPVIKIGVTHMHTEHLLECRVSACTALGVREILG